MNIYDILILAIIAVAVFFAIRRMCRTKKCGGCSCGCNAPGCDKGRKKTDAGTQ